MGTDNPQFQNVAALKVRQWLHNWDDAVYTAETPRKKPDPSFYLFSMSAYELKKLCGIYRRDPNTTPAEDLGIQRRHIKEKSDEILRYIQDGFPLSKINKERLVAKDEVTSLRMPGWLSTAVIVNILKKDDQRGTKGSRVPAEHLINIEDHGDKLAQILIPKECLAPNWKPVVHPIEVIDGQHRLWALEKPIQLEQGTLWDDDFENAVRDVEIPVVAFHGLDRTWQAYLFYTINQLPKKVDSSLVYDLYPLLRTQEWLQRFEGPEVYRQTRSQDLALLLWSNDESPWKGRISRLGREKGKVTQASFIRALLASFVKSYSPMGKGKIGGLFGSLRKQHDLVLDWTREQQAAFLIKIWCAVRDAVSEARDPWAEKLRQKKEDPFTGESSLLATDQGVRCILSIMNDIVWLAYDDKPGLLDGYSWARDPDIQDDDEAVKDAMEHMNSQLVDAISLIRDIAEVLAKFDWRTSSAVDRDNESQQHDRQASYRGSSGYRSIRLNALDHIVKKAHPSPLSTLAKKVHDLSIESSEDALI